jgi:hypothetical protein
MFIYYVIEHQEKLALPIKQTTRTIHKTKEMSICIYV